MLCFSENLFCSSPGGTSSLLAIDAPQPRAEESPEWLVFSLGKKRVPGVMVEVVQGSSSAYPCSFSCIYSCLSSGGFPSGSAGKNHPANKGNAAGSAGTIPGLGRSPGEGNGKLLQYLAWKNPMDRGTWGL